MPWLKTTKTAKKINKKYLRYWWRWGSPVWTHSCCHCSRLRCKSAYSSSSHLDTSWQPKGQVKWRFNWTNTTRTLESNTSQAERKGPIACRGRRWSGICVSISAHDFFLKLFTTLLAHASEHAAGFPATPHSHPPRRRCVFAAAASAGEAYKNMMPISTCCAGYIRR